MASVAPAVTYEDVTEKGLLGLLEKLYMGNRAVVCVVPLETTPHSEAYPNDRIVETWRVFYATPALEEHDMARMGKSLWRS